MCRWEALCCFKLGVCFCLNCGCRCRLTFTSTIHDGVQTASPQTPYPLSTGECAHTTTAADGCSCYACNCCWYCLLLIDSPTKLWDKYGWLLHDVSIDHSYIYLNRAVFVFFLIQKKQFKSLHSPNHPALVSWSSLPPNGWRRYSNNGNMKKCCDVELNSLNS